MEPKVLTVGKVALAVGLEWVDASATSNLRKEVRRLAVEKGVRRGLVFGGDEGERLVGFPSADPGAPLPRSALSLAVLLAGYPGIAPDALFVCATGDDTAVVVGLRNGMPAHGFEGHGTVEEVRALAKRFTSMVPSGITVYGTGAALEAVPLTIEQLLENSTTRSQSKIGAVGGSEVALLLLLLLVAGGAGGYFWYAASQEAQRQQLAVHAAAQEDPNKLYMAQVEPELASRERLHPTRERLMAVLDQTPLLNGGWVLEQAVCSGGACVFRWTRDFGTNASFELPAGAVDVQRTPDGANLTYVVPYESSRGFTLQELGSMDDLLLKSMSKFQELGTLGVSFSVTAPTIIGTPTVPPEALEVVVKEGSYILEGPWWAASSTAHLPASGGIDQVELIGGDAPQFKILGRYHVK